MMKRTDVTYGQLNKALALLGLTRRLLNDDPPTNVYEHPERGLIVSLPAFPSRNRVYEHHLIGVRTLLDQFGIAEPTAFDAELQKAA